MPEDFFENISIPWKESPPPWNKCGYKISSSQAGGSVQGGPWNHGPRAQRLRDKCHLRIVQRTSSGQRGVLLWRTCTATRENHRWIMKEWNVHVRREAKPLFHRSSRWGPGRERTLSKVSMGPSRPHDSFSGDASSALVLSLVLPARTQSQCQGCALHSLEFLEFSGALLQNQGTIFLTWICTFSRCFQMHSRLGDCYLSRLLGLVTQISTEGFVCVWAWRTWAWILLFFPF